jgi:hypothetical protein
MRDWQRVSGGQPASTTSPEGPPRMGAPIGQLGLDYFAAERSGDGKDGDYRRTAAGGEVQGGSGGDMERREGENMASQHKNGGGKHLAQGLTERMGSAAARRSG